MFRKLSFIAILLALVLSSCSHDVNVPNDPKNVLTAYISKSFHVKDPSDRAVLVGYLTRDAKARLSAWSDDQFTHAFIDDKRQFIKLLFTEAKSVSPTQMDITYELSYIDQAKGDGAKVTQKKMATMMKDDGKWLIADVKSIKELVEYRNEMALP